MVRTPSSNKSGIKKGTWTPEEDRKLVAYITRYGSWNWRQLPRFAGLERCGKSCRLRWLNYLRPNIKRGNYTEEEEEMIIRLHEKLGNKWSVIATHLPGRTDNEIKNHWHTTLKKRFGKDAVHTNENEEATKSNNFGSKQDREQIQNNGFFQSSSPTTSKTSATNETLLLEDEFDFLNVCLEDVNENIWTESYAAKDNSNDNFHNSDAKGFMSSWVSSESPLSSCTENLVLENDFDFLEETSAKFWTEAYVADMSLFPNELLAPLVNQSEKYFSSMYDIDIDLWSHSNSHDLHVPTLLQYEKDVSPPPIKKGK